MLTCFPSSSIAEIKVCHDKVAHFTLIGYCFTPDRHISFVLSSSSKIEDFNSGFSFIKENPELKSSILEEDDKTKLMCLSGVKQYPMRVKCATLSWHTLISAMEDDGKQVSTED